MGMAIAMHLLRGEGRSLRKWLRWVRAYVIGEMALVMFNVGIPEVLLWVAA